MEEHFLWRKRWDKVLSWDFEKPEIKWFEGAKLNITENCIYLCYKKGSLSVDCDGFCDG